MNFFLFRQGRAFRRLIAISLVVGAGGGCFAIGYDFDKQPPAVCKTAADCPGLDTQCGTRACEQGACRFVNVRPLSFVPPAQLVGDCSIGRCDGVGNLVFEIDETDVPFDGNDCTEDTCVQGTPQNMPSPLGKTCGLGMTTQCNGVGACIGCTLPADCGNDTVCVQWGCDVDVCKPMIAPVGTVASNPQAGDCLAELCGANGKPTTAFFKDDPEEDGNPCTFGVCLPDGKTMQTNEPEGKKCGDCLKCTNGMCGKCEPDYLCKAMMTCEPLLTLDVGAACTYSADCKSGYCVDNVCCESECSGACFACSNQKTGQPNGKCAAVSDGTDPDMDCMTPEADVCVGGVCQCSNGIQDGSENKVDCGGNCTPCAGQWVCSGGAGCGAPKKECCALNCFVDCPDSTATCMTVEGTSCVVGVDPPKAYSAGALMDASCLSTYACKRMTCVCQ